jgi:hypothetical protein
VFDDHPCQAAEQAVHDVHTAAVEHDEVVLRAVAAPDNGREGEGGLQRQR